MAATASKVALSLGLFQTTVDIHTSVSSKGSGGSGLSNFCAGPEDNPHAEPVKIKQTLACPNCHSEDRESWLKGRPVAGGTFAIIPKGTVEQAAEVASKSKELNFSYFDATEIDAATITTGTPYYLSVRSAPGTAPSRAYAVVATWLETNPDVALITQFAVSSATALYRLRVRDGLLMLHKVSFPADLHQPPAVPTLDERDAPHLERVDDWLRSQIKPFVAEEWADERRTILAESEGQVVQGTTEAATAQVFDLAALLAQAKPKRTRKPAVAKSA